MGKKKYDDDDGRTVSNMDIDGMPWTNPLSYRYKGKKNNETEKIGSDLKPTFKESVSVALSAVLAALLIAGVFALVFAVFILITTHAWQ